MKKFLCCLIIIITCFTIKNVDASNTFFDTRGTKYEGVVERMARLGIVNGMTETTYAPNKGVTRAELAKIITKIRGLDDYTDSVTYKKVFTDVKKSDWFYPYVMIASDLDLINGYEDGTFKPNQEVTYAELVALLLRNLGYTRISENHENGWYWNYIVRMREIELNDNIGEFNYTDSAKRGDVAMFVWNSLITDRWAISMENEKEGFTYTYSDETPLEIFFDEYNFLDNEIVNYLGGKEEQIIIGAQNKYFYTNEKTPLYVLGGRITALYNIESNELIGVTFDEEYQNIEIVSGPKFYLAEQGYKISAAVKSFCYGEKSNANYIYLIIDKSTNKILRAVYIDSSNSMVVEKFSVNDLKESGDISTLKQITINEQEYTSEHMAFIEDGFRKNVKSVKTEDVITELGNGLYAYSDKTITGELTGYKFNEKNNTIELDGDKYIISNDCKCYLYNEQGHISYNDLVSKGLKKYLGKNITAHVNIAEEIYMLDLPKTDGENQKYKIGFITDVYNIIDKEDSQRISIDFGDEKLYSLTIKNTSNQYAEKGELIAIYEEKGETIYQILSNDKAFDNDISVKYNYDAKKIAYPMIGEYIVNEYTKYYKVNKEYENNSVTKIKSCEISEMSIDSNIEELEAYTLILIYNEDMEVIRVYAVNELNKYTNQLAIIRDVQVRKNENDNEVMYVTLGIAGEALKKYQVTERHNKMSSGDIITFTYNENVEDRIIIPDETFKKESIGYKRDMVVEKYDKNNKTVIFKNGNPMELNKDIYDWDGEKINLNKYRFVIAEVAMGDEGWRFASLDIINKEKLILEKGDRFAIGELQGVIVIYRGYEE